MTTPADGGREASAHLSADKQSEREYLRQVAAVANKGGYYVCSVCSVCSRLQLSFETLSLLSGAALMNRIHKCLLRPNRF